MKKLFQSEKKPSSEQPPEQPPSYEQSESAPALGQEEIPQYSGQYGPNEYPEEKKGGGYLPEAGQGSSSHSSESPGMYVVPPQKINIAYESDNTNTRPGYTEYLQKDKERIAQGDLPKHRDAFKHGGAPLEPSRQGGGSSGGFPGAHGPTYYNTSQK